MTKKRGLSRRDFLKMSAVGTSSFLVATQFGVKEVFPAPARQEEEITFYWNPGHVYDAYGAIIEAFQVDYPNVTVNWEKFQWPDMRTKLLADFAAGTVPDMTAEPGGWVQEFAQAGTIIPLTEFIEADGEAMGFPDDWQPYTVSRNTHDGEVYGVQIHLTCGLLFYNIDMLEAAGFSEPPTTWEEFREIAIATANGSVFGFAPNQSADYTWPWLLQNGVRYYDEATNTVPLDNEAAYEAMQFQADLIHVDNAAPIPIAAADYEGPQKLFNAERAAMILTGPWDIKPISEGSPDLNWGIAQATTREEQSTFAAGVSMMIPEGARNPELGWELMKRFTTLEAEIAATREAGMCMPRISWANSAEVEEIPRIAAFAEGLGYAVDVSAGLRTTGKYGEIAPLFNVAYEEVIYTNRPAEEALSEFAAAANAILAES